MNPKTYTFYFSVSFLFLFSCQNRKNIDSSIDLTSVIENKFTIVDSVHFLHGYPTWSADSLINMIVEIPTGTLEKWEVNKESGYLELPEINGRRRIVEYLGYPANYGMVPQTLQDKATGGDGDPLDILVLGSPFTRGSVQPCRIIGVIRMLDNGEWDDKLIALPSEGYFDQIHSIESLNVEFPGIIDILTTWLKNYKGPGQVEIITVGDKNMANQILNDAAAAYRSNQSKK